MKQDLHISRRNFLAATGGTIISIGLPGTFRKLFDFEQEVLAAQVRPDGRPRIPPGQEVIKSIYDMGGRPGNATEKTFKLYIKGEVEKPLVLTFKDLLALEQVQMICDVHCVTGWTLLDSRWGGIRLSTIMNLAKIKKEANFVVFEAPSGYTTNIPLTEARKDNVLLAHTFSGQKLPKEHGAPVRALVPDRYFYKSAKWIEGIKFTVKDEPGYWERNGYSNSADPWKEERYRGGST
ncbi:MAG TPA: molybdopterin-dependent oxidoreductase [Thermodesulfobacteriota bacterium]|nr:molybdopterin-dependent oxidoreductase [Thermodesulfobacteriota bacterium]